MINLYSLFPHLKLLLYYYLWKIFFFPLTFFSLVPDVTLELYFYLDVYCEALKKLDLLVFGQCACPLLAVRCKQVNQWEIFSPPSLVVHILIASSVEMQVSLVKPSSSIQSYRWFECFLASV